MTVGTKKAIGGIGMGFTNFSTGIIGTIDTLASSAWSTLG